MTKLKYIYIYKDKNFTEISGFNGHGNKLGWQNVGGGEIKKKKKNQRVLSIYFGFLPIYRQFCRFFGLVNVRVVWSTCSQMVKPSKILNCDLLQALGLESKPKTNKRRVG